LFNIPNFEETSFVHAIKHVGLPCCRSALITIEHWILWHGAEGTCLYQQQVCNRNQPCALRT